VKETWGDPERYLEKSLGQVALYIGAPLLSNLEEGFSIGDFESRKGSGDGHLFLQRLRLGNLEDGLSAGTLRVRRRDFVSMTPCVGNVVLRRKPQFTFCVSVRL
jgi:hypothetical protein